jgi:hypothetical protein
MTRDELLKLHKETCEKCFAIIRKKNQDYSGGTGDPFSNFTASEIFGVSGEIGILMRSMDKFQRIRSFVETGTLAVKSESVDDALEDVINYMILLKGLIKHKQEGQTFSGKSVESRSLTRMKLDERNRPIPD